MKIGICLGENENEVTNLTFAQAVLDVEKQGYIDAKKVAKLILCEKEDNKVLIDISKEKQDE